MHQKQCLVTGGHGFIGQHVVQRLVEQGFHVTVITTQKPQTRLAMHYDVLQLDLESSSSLSVLTKIPFEYVIHLGGYINHQPFFKGGRSVINNHYLSLLNLLEHLNRDRLKRFIQIGSSDEYGGLQAPQQESLREAPISPYATSKVNATHLIQMLAATEGFPGTVLRFFLVYGPGQNAQRFLPQVIQGCLHNRTFPTSLGSQLRDFCYIEDVVDAICCVLKQDHPSGQVYNIASGQPITIRHMIEKIQMLIGQGTPDFGAFPERRGENKALYANIEKAKSQFGWSPKIDLATGLTKTIQYYRDQLSEKV